MNPSQNRMDEIDLNSEISWNDVLDGELVEITQTIPGKDDITISMLRSVAIQMAKEILDNLWDEE